MAGLHREEEGEAEEGEGEEDHQDHHLLINNK